MKAKAYQDPVLAVYKRDVDRTLLRQNLKLTPGQRLEKLCQFSRFATTLRQAGAKAKARKGGRG